MTSMLEPAGVEAGDRASASLTWRIRLRCLNWTGERLTATRTCSGQVRRPEAGLAQHPFADRDDQPGFLGDRDEPVGRDRPALRVVPAQQRLDAADAVVAEAEERLEDERQLVPRQRAAELDLERRRSWSAASMPGSKKW